jgi:hypothetical protein
MAPGCDAMRYGRSAGIVSDRNGSSVSREENVHDELDGKAIGIGHMP